MLDNIKTVEDTMPAGIAGAWPWLNRWVQTGRTEFGDSDVPPYVTALMTALTEYAKIMSGATGAAGITDTARAEALHMLNENMNKETVMKVFKVIRRDAENRKRRLYGQLELIKGGIADQDRPGGPTEKAEEPADTNDKTPDWAR